MTVSDLQLVANQTNAAKSTGPRTIEGKAASSKNAVRHGLFSSRLFLDDENPDEFQTLQIDLQFSLKPNGTLELALVERIAVNMWRQRRLVGAETARLDLARRDQKIARSVSREMDYGLGKEIGENELQPFDKEQADWCRAVIDEYDRIDDFNIDTLPKLAPLVFAQLKSDAKTDGESIADHLSDFENGLTGFVERLYSWCHKQLRIAEQRPAILAVADKIRQKEALLPRPHLELLARYQTTLDNQLYKALRALRDAQDWRQKSLDGEIVDADAGD